MSTVTAHVWNPTMTTYKGELVEAHAIGWQDPAGDCGSASLTIGRGEPYLAAGNSVSIGDVIRLHVDGTPAFAWRLEDYDYVQLSPSDEVGEGWALRGRGTLALTESAIVYPALGARAGEGPDRALVSDTRVWNFASPELDESGWDDNVFEIEAAHTGVNYGLVKLFCDPLAYWIWDRAQPGGIGINNAPAGTCYFRTTFTKSAAGKVEVWGAADDSFELWVNGIKVVGDPGYYKGNVRRAGPFTLDAGSHKIAIRGTNQNAAKAGVLASVIEVDEAGLYGDVICRTDDTWLCLSYPSSPPGFTPGKILRIVIDEAVNGRGALAGFGAGFGDNVDTDGVPWPTLSEFSCPVGATLYDVIRTLGEAFCDFRMRATDLTLDAWVKGTAGVDLSASVLFENFYGDPERDNLRGLTHAVRNVGTISG